MALFCCAVLGGAVCLPLLAQEGSDEQPARLANGVALEGVVKSAAPEGLTIETPKGVKTFPWKYLSTGTRYRYEQPMLAALAKAKAAAEAKQKAAAEKAAKDAAAKAAAEAAKKAAGTNAAPAVAPSVPKVTAPASTVPAVPGSAKSAVSVAK